MISSTKSPSRSVKLVAIDDSASDTRQLSRMMNSINPNDLLAKRVIDIAQYNRTGDSFIKGEKHFIYAVDVKLTMQLSRRSESFQKTRFYRCIPAYSLSCRSRRKMGIVEAQDILQR